MTAGWDACQGSPQDYDNKEVSARTSENKFLYRSRTWYTVVNDLVGGWSISTSDKPLSEHRPNPDTGDDICFADVITEQDGNYMCTLHNAALMKSKEHG